MDSKSTEPGYMVSELRCIITFPDGEDIKRKRGLWTELLIMLDSKVSAMGGNMAWGNGESERYHGTPNLKNPQQYFQFPLKVITAPITDPI